MVGELDQPRSMDPTHKVNKTAAHSQHMENSEAELIKVLQEPLNTFHNQPSNSFSGGSMFAIGAKHLRTVVESASIDKNSQSSKKIRPPSTKVVKKGNLVATDKIASSGKVIASGSVVKHRPKSTNRGHQRVKSDEVYSQKVKDLIL